MLGNMLGNAIEISREAILKRSIRNPILHHCIQEWQRGRMTFESAMKHAVMALVESNEIMTAQLENKYTKSTTPKIEIEIDKSTNHLCCNPERGKCDLFDECQIRLETSNAFKNHPDVGGVYTILFCKKQANHIVKKAAEG